MKKTSVREALKKFICRFDGRMPACAAILVIAILVMPPPSEGQFSPSSALSSGLGAIGGAITNVVGGGLDAVKEMLTSIRDFEAETVWPEDLIDRALEAVNSIQEIFHEIRDLSHISVASATLPSPRQLEQTLLSGDTDQLSSVESQYRAVYSAIPAATSASPQVRNLIDMTDAAAQAAMKRAIAIDAIAELELDAADQISEEIQAAAPGSAPIIEAGAAAWLVRANAHTQAALTELIRLRAIDLANASAEMKLGAQNSAQLRDNVTNALQRR